MRYFHHFRLLSVVILLQIIFQNIDSLRNKYLHSC
ncbi:hypothetical protein HORM4_930063 [Vibrio harveyi]|nr:hypothetical protein HORM4_930063 [Vibrio harveyi]